MTQPTKDRFYVYPNNRIVAFIAEANDAQVAVEALHAAGYEGDDVLDVFHGDEGARKLDIHGDRHGILGKIARVAQQFGDAENELHRVSDEALSAGHYLFAVFVGVDETKKQWVANLLRQQRAYHIVYYGAIGAELLD